MRKRLGRFFELMLCICICLSYSPLAYASASKGATIVPYISNYDLRDTYNLPDWESGCFTSCVTMALMTLGKTVTPKDIWTLNGNTTYINSWKAIGEEYNVNMTKQTGLTGDPADKKDTLRSILCGLPSGEQFVLLYVNAYFDASAGQFGHVVVLFLDDSGQFRINDPGLANGESTTIDETYMMSKYRSSDEKWNNVRGYRIICHPDVDPPTFIDGPYVTVQSNHQFTIRFRATDDTGVTDVYARLAYDSPNGIKPDKSNGEGTILCPGSIDGNLATITVNANDYSGQLKNFWFSCVAVDRFGNEAVADSDLRAVSLYPLTINGKKDCGRFKTTVEDAPLCIVPYEEYDGNDMTSVRISKGYDNLYVAGKHINDLGETWYFVEPNLWIKSDYVSRKSNDAEIWAKVGGFINSEFYRVGNSYVEPSIETYLKSYKSSNVAVYTEYDDDGEPIDPVEQKPQYTVSFNACGGHCGRLNYTVTYESPYGELPVPSRKGYQFDGWFTQADGGAQITSQDIYSISEDQTLFAHWTRIVLEQGICGENLSYILYGDGQLDITGAGEMSSSPWTANNAARVETVSLPEGITSLCSKAFNDCSGLVEISLPDSLTIIDDWCFEDCVLLEAVHLPANLNQLGLGAFHNCESIEEINIPSSVTTKELAGENTEYYQGPFAGCTSLTKIKFDEGITTIPEGLFADCVFKEIVLPSTVTSIATKAFARCKDLVSITFPEGLQSIGQNAFMDCVGIEKLQLPALLSLLDLGAFYNCTTLCSVNIPTNVHTGHLSGENIEYYQGPFAGCSSLNDIVFDSGITVIPEGMFADCAFTEIEIPTTVTSISDKAFIRCAKLETIVFPGTLKTIGSQVFEKCANLKTLTFPEGLETIGAYAFQSCTGIEKIHLPAGLKKLDNGAFTECTSLQSVNIPNNVATGELAGENDYYRGPFYGCTALDSIVFDAGITSIPEGLFADCSFSEIEIPATVTTIGDKVFARCSNLRIIYGVSGSYAETYAKANSITFVPRGVVAVILPTATTVVEEQAFMNSGIQSVILGINVTSVESEAFSNCKNLGTVEFSSASVMIADDAFSGSNVAIIAPGGGKVESFADSHNITFIAK